MMYLNELITWRYLRYLNAIIGWFYYRENDSSLVYNCLGAVYLYYYRVWCVQSHIAVTLRLCVELGDN